MTLDTLRLRRLIATCATLSLATACTGTGASSGSTPGTGALPTVASVDLARYAGTWYEIARLPAFFQKQCLGDVTATYTPLPGKGVEVVNRCRTGTGSAPAFDTATGLARTLDASNAVLQVSFLPSALRWLPIGWGDYQVIALDPDYRWVMVGEPGRRYLWILSRTKTLPPGVQDTLVKRARDLGFPTDQIVPTPHGT
jgi:apolipoprotein D and lipocalin family protein